MNKADGGVRSTKIGDKTCSEITMKDFLDFLRTAYQVNEAIDGGTADIKEKTQVNWKKLTNYQLISELKAKDLENAQKDPNDAKIKSGKSETSDKSPEKSKKEVDAKDKPGRDKPILTKERRLSNTSIQRRKGSFASKKDSSSIESSKSSDSTTSTGSKTPEKILKKKLNEVLQEGILDSVLPYLLPKQQPNGQNLAKRLTDLKRSSPSHGDKSEKQSSDSTSREQKEPKKDHRRKSVTSNDNIKTKDVEVIIHVCDEIKNLRKDFRCPQKLLVSQMGYFSEVTAGQKLEDMDISVHCDITIFDWLMRWVKKEQTSEDNWPTLDPNIVVPVLMSSAFLQMDALQDHCLCYCKQNINEIIRDSGSLACLNDSILTRLANMFTNSDLELLRDRKDKLQSKLYSKLIVSLADPKPEEAKGHFSTLASLYRCLRCNKLILKNYSIKIQCIPSSMTMDRSGSIQSIHTRDSSWNLSDYVKDLKLELKTWRRVYWRLWSDCHLLSCGVCQTWFPPHQMSWCRFHAESPQFFTMENQRSMSFPIGRYPCCGERAYRFEIAKNQTGCQYREHNPQIKSEKEQAVHKLWLDQKELIRQEPPALVFPERLTRIVSSREENGGGKSPCKEPLWWEGLQLVPSKPKQGLLTKIWDNFLKKEEQKRPSSDPNTKSTNQRSPLKRHVSVPQQPASSDVSSNSDSSDIDSASSDDVNSEESCHATVRVTAKPRGQSNSNTFVQNPRNEGSRFWVSKLSTRCNQDNQREFEERAVRQMETILAKKTSGESLTHSLRSATSRSFAVSTPLGGSYIRLEQEWREAHCHSHGCPGSSSKTRINYLPSTNSVSSSRQKMKTQR